MDIWVVERKEITSKWSKPKNLGTDVNSFGVELNYFIDQENNIAYFSSTQNSDGYGACYKQKGDVGAESWYVSNHITWF